MKRHLGFLTLLALSVACHQTDNASGPLDQKASNQAEAAIKPVPARQVSYDFQTLGRIDVNLPGEDPNRLVGDELINREKYLGSAGFSHSDDDFADQTKDQTWQQADERYRAFVAAHANDTYQPIFRRVGSFRILRDKALLADHSEAGKKAIAFYLNELRETKTASSAGIYYYGLKALDGYWSPQQVGKFAQTVLQSYDQSPSFQVMKTVMNDQAQLVKLKQGADQNQKFAVEQGEKYWNEENTYLNKLKALSAQS